MQIKFSKIKWGDLIIIINDNAVEYLFTRQKNRIVSVSNLCKLALGNTKFTDITWNPNFVQNYLPKKWLKQYLPDLKLDPKSTNYILPDKAIGIYNRPKHRVKSEYIESGKRDNSSTIIVTYNAHSMGNFQQYTTLACDENSSFIKFCTLSNLWAEAMNNMPPVTDKIVEFIKNALTKTDSGASNMAIDLLLNHDLRPYLQELFAWSCTEVVGNWITEYTPKGILDKFLVKCSTDKVWHKFFNESIFRGVIGALDFEFDKKTVVPLLSESIFKADTIRYEPHFFDTTAFNCCTFPHYGACANKIENMVSPWIDSNVVTLPEFMQSFPTVHPFTFVFNAENFTIQEYESINKMLKIRNSSDTAEIMVYYSKNLIENYSNLGTLNHALVANNINTSIPAKGYYLISFWQYCIMYYRTHNVNRTLSLQDIASNSISTYCENWQDYDLEPIIAFPGYLDTFAAENNPVLRDIYKLKWYLKGCMSDPVQHQMSISTYIKTYAEHSTLGKELSEILIKYNLDKILESEV